MTLPGWPGEDARCPGCGFDFATTDLAETAPGTAEVAIRLRELVARHPQRLRDRGDGWSAVEYICHLRDVFVAGTVRLYRARTEDVPRVDPLLNDLRAERFDYAHRDVEAVLEDLDACRAGFAAELDRLRDADRPVERRPGERRTAGWIALSVLHEGRHHLLDIERLLTAA